MDLSEFERLVYEHQDRVYGFACRMLRSHADAQDITQDVLVRLWRLGDDLDRDRVLAWLMRVTRNACIDVIRHRKTVRGVVTAGADPDAVPHGERSPADEAESGDERSVVMAALDELSEPYRSIVILREIEGLKYEEISGAMDMPLNTVKVYIHRGRKQLRTVLEERIDRERV